MNLKERKDPVRDDYFDAVRHRLLDIPWPERQQLLSDLVIRLDDLPPRAAPQSVLGRPETYATLMREAAGYAPEPPRRFAYVRSWRLRRKILVAMTLFLIAVVLPVAVMQRRRHDAYQPLVTSVFSSTATAERFEYDLPLDADYYHYRRGASLAYGIDLHNPGHATATVTGFVVPHSPYGPIVPIELRITHDPNNCCEWQKATPAARIEVRPRTHVTAFVVMKMVPWRIGEDAYIHQPLPTLRVEVFGREHLLPIDGQQIGVVGPS